MLEQSVKKRFKPGLKVVRATSRTINTIGSAVPTWAIINPNLSGIIVTKSGQRQLIAGEPATTSVHVLYCELTDLKPGDRIVDQAGAVYKVNHTRDPQQRGIFLKSDLEFVGNEQQGQSLP